MYLIYIDESGKPNRKDQENYTLVGFCINEQHYQTIDKKVDELKSKYFPKIDLDNVEIHARDIAYNKKVYTSLTFDQRFHLFEDVFKLIADIDCSIIATVIRKKEVIKQDLDLELWGFILLFDRFCILLDKKNKGQSDKPGEFALLLLDSVNQNYDIRLRNKIINMLRIGTDYQDNKYIIEDPLFVTSKYRNMSQLVDCIAFCVRRYYRAKEKEKKSYLDKYFEKYFDIIKDKFDKSEEGEIENYGIKLWP